jgi:hypothetical protein
MSASSDDPLSIIAFAEQRWETIGGVAAGGIMGIILQFGVSITDLVGRLFDILILPLGAMGEQLGNIVTAFLGGVATIIQQGAQTTVASIAPGATWAVGPLTFAFGILAAGAGLAAMAWFLSLEVTSNIIPGSFTDVPFFGVDEEDEDLEG